MNSKNVTGTHRWDQRTGFFYFVGDGFPQAVKALFERPVVGLALYSLALIGFYLLIEQCMKAVFAIPLSAYSSNFLLLSAVTHFGWTARLLLVGFSLTLILLDPARLRWHEFSGGPALRFAIVVLAFLMVWPLTTYGYNYAVDAGHLFDRMLLLGTFLLLIWRPVFALPLLLLAYILFAQLTAPSLGGSVIPHKTQVLRAIELFVAFYFVRIVFGYHRTSGYLFVLGCYVAASYWLPAWAKLQLDWLSGNDLNLVPMAAYAHGWRGTYSLDQVADMGARLQSVAPLFKVTALVIEAAFVLFFFRYRLAIFLLMAAITFHLGVFYLFGFFFWTWIVLDVVLIALLILHRKAESLESLFGLKYVPLAAVLIVTGPYWAKPPGLGWYDTPLTYAYKFKATMDDGEEVTLNPKFFAPYEDAFTMTGFSYLVKEHGTLVGPYGVTGDTDLYQQITEAATFEQIKTLENARKGQGFNQERASRFYQFVEQFVRTRNMRGDLQQWLYKLHSPVQFWSNSEGLINLDERKIRRVTIVENTYFYDGNTLKLARQLPLHTITITGSL